MNQYETFRCLYCFNLRDEWEQPARFWNPSTERWRCCVVCAAIQSDLCNCCGSEVSGYDAGSPLSLCSTCKSEIGWDD